MAVAQEFIDIFVRLTDVERVIHGGVKAYLKDAMGNMTVWHDDYILREGAMNNSDAESLVKRWEEAGLTPFLKRNGKLIEWLDVCISIGPAGGPTAPCAWIAYDDETGGAYLSGTVPGRLIGRSAHVHPSSENETWISDPSFRQTT